METDRYQPMLHGWNDGRIYFLDKSGKEWCVSNYPDLVAQLVEVCLCYFAAGSGGRDLEKANNEVVRLCNK